MTKTNDTIVWFETGPAGNPDPGLTRRRFISRALAASLMVGATPGLLGSEKRGDMVFRNFGNTGEKISVLGLGGYHIGLPKDEEESIRLMRSAIDHGITFMDNCWDYHNGLSEIRMGKALRDGYRRRVFLMSKIDGQTRSSASSQIDESLARLQTDHIDLMQFHEVIRFGDPERIFGPDGAIEAMLAAKKAGKVRYIGFTGHKDPEIHLHMLAVARKNNLRMDAVQMPLNVMDVHFRSFEKKVLPVLIKNNIAVLGMKPMASGHILKSAAVRPVECLHYAMNLPTATVITGIERQEILDQALEAVRTFQPLSGKAVAALMAKTAVHAADGKFEPFKTTTNFDGTVHNPQWLG